MRWVYQRGVFDFDEMTDISLRLRRELRQIACLELPQAIRVEESADGTRKWLVNVGGGQAVETVHIPEPNRARHSVFPPRPGAPWTARSARRDSSGFNRNLKAAEILGQVLLANRRPGIALGDHQRGIHGYGRTARQLSCKWWRWPGCSPTIYGLGLSRRRVTISTVGLVPQIRRLAADCNVALAVSLHAPTDDIQGRSWCQSTAATASRNCCAPAGNMPRAWLRARSHSNTSCWPV